MDGLRSPCSESLPFAGAIHGGTKALRGVPQAAHECGERPRMVFGRADRASKIPLLGFSPTAGTLPLVPCLGQSVQGLLELDPLRMLTTLLHGCASLVLDGRCIAQNLRQRASLTTKPVARLVHSRLQDLHDPFQRIATALKQIGAPRGRRLKVGESV